MMIDKRLGRNGVQEIKDHPFFKGTDWDGLSRMTVVAPNVPQVVYD